jgi:hypothetical protein
MCRVIENLRQQFFCCFWLLADQVMSDRPKCFSIGAGINALPWFQPLASGKEIVLRPLLWPFLGIDMGL